MKLTKEQEKQLAELPQETQDAIISDSWKGENRYERSLDFGPLKPLIQFLDEKEIPRVDKSVDGLVVVEADFTNVDFATRLAFHTEAGTVSEEIAASEEEAGDNMKDTDK